jgi:hypothetical protein
LTPAIIVAVVAGLGVIGLATALIIQRRKAAEEAAATDALGSPDDGTDVVGGPDATPPVPGGGPGPGAAGPTGSNPTGPTGASPTGPTEPPVDPPAPP